jgi:thiosulfate/3-mercaptopyruvate sulfurtransferase
MTMVFRTLIDTVSLADRLDDRSCAIVDCRVKLDDPEWGPAEYRYAHIAGAVFADLGRDLAGPKTGRNGRHPLPDPDAFTRTLSRLGIDSSVQVVAYDQADGMYAARLWWMLRWMGHEAVAVLDGGFARWVEEERPTRAGVETRAPRTFNGRANWSLVASLEEVSRVAAGTDFRLVDARAPERFTGATEPIDRVPGHIPGAINYFFKGNVDEAGRFRTADDLRQQLQHGLAGTPPERVIVYCGSGVTACHNILALEHAGLPGARLYPGSWSEWSSDPSRPVATGAGSVPNDS